MSNHTETEHVEALDEAECRTLLGGQEIGRVAYVVDGAPMIMPVDFIVFDDMIVFRSDPGSKVVNIPLRNVCFEADGRLESNIVWSVIVQGHARDVTTALNEQFERMRRTRVASFATLSEPHWLMIEIEHITGRRLTR